MKFSTIFPFNSFYYLGDMLSAAGGCDDDEFRFNNASTHEGHLRQNGELTWFCNEMIIISHKCIKCKTKTNLKIKTVAGGCELSTTTRVKTAWKKFKDLLPVLSSRHLSFKTRGHVYSSCVRSAMLHASETWPLTKPNLQHLQRNDRAMIRQICNVRPQDIVTTRSNDLLVRLGIEDLDLILKERRL